MKLCILCEDSKIELARENTKSLIIERTKSDIEQKLSAQYENDPKHLRIACSPTGELPATHWFCFVNSTEDGYKKLLEIQEHSIIEESGPKEFLLKWNLKIIR